MSYQALLFCPDEKIASTVTRVLSELEFTVVPCAEPFAAVKQLMAERFDAVVVDCDNEQNAALLFKSARGSASNQTALAVAVVEGQAGVAKAFRLGANLVLTKPVNIEQAKGTLRVARGLLKKNEIAKAAAAAGATIVPQKPAPVPVVTAPPMPGIAFESVPPAPVRPPAQRTPTFTTTEKRPASIARPEAPASAPASLAAARVSALGSAMGSAAAPAPARESKISDEQSLTSKPAPGIDDAPSAAIEKSQSAADAPSAAPYSFTFGGTNAKPSSEASPGGSKKILGVVAAVVVLGAAAYYGWTTLRPSAPANGEHAASPVVTAPVKAQPAATLPAPTAAQPGVAGAPKLGNTANGPAAAAIKTETPDAPEANTPGTASKSAPATAPLSKSSASPATSPIKVGRTSTISINKSETEIAAPGVVAMSSPDASSLPGISPSQPVLPKPVLQTVNISQGVAQGLVVKRVQPHYPQSAVQQRIEGDVNLVATISKNGDITAVKVIGGQSVLVGAAVEAVRQWKYKPYLLNGEPVEIQTDVTVKFKLPK